MAAVATYKESEKQRLSNNNSFSDQCRHLEFRPEHASQGKRLLNHVIRVYDPVIKDFCDALCYMEHNCASYNLMRRSEPEGHRCELNNATYEGNENDLEENANYLYRGTKVTLIVQIIIACKRE